MVADGYFPPYLVACEQALWLGKERRKGKSEENKGREQAWSTLSSLADLFSPFSPTADPVHRLLPRVESRASLFSPALPLKEPAM